MNYSSEESELQQPLLSQGIATLGGSSPLPPSRTCHLCCVISSQILSALGAQGSQGHTSSENHPALLSTSPKRG